MTLQQLEYVMALEKTRHFVRAAELCGGNTANVKCNGSETGR